MQRACEYGNADAGQQAQRRVDGLDQFGCGGLVVGIHEIRDFAFGAQDTILALVIIFHLHDAVETDRFAHGVHLGGLGVDPVEPCPQGHGHFQAEGGAAGDTQFFQAEHAVHKAGGKGKGQQGVDGEAGLQKVRDAVDHQLAAQQGGAQHSQDLAEDHQTQPVFGNHVQGEHGGNAGADQNDEDVQQQRGLELDGAFLGKLIVPFFGTGHQLLFQLLQTGAGGKDDGGGNEFFLHLKGRLYGSGLGGFGGGLRGERVVSENVGVFLGLRGSGGCFGGLLVGDGSELDGVPLQRGIGIGLCCVRRFRCGLLSQLCRDLRLLDHYGGNGQLRHVQKSVQLLVGLHFRGFFFGNVVEFVENVVQVKLLGFVFVVHTGFLLMGCAYGMEGISRVSGALPRTIKWMPRRMRSGS